MADSFAELGLNERVIEAARAAGFERPTALQSAAVAVLRRGSNAVLHASTGAGVTATYGLALLDRLLEDGAGPGVRALVLTPNRERASHVTDALAALAGDTGIAVRTTAPGWRTSDAAILVTTPQQAMADVRSSTLKLDGLQTLVVTDATQLFALGGATALDTLIGLVPRDAQRVITSAQIGDDVERFIESHLRRALTVPPRPADPEQTPAPQESAGQIGYMVVPANEKLEVLSRLLEGADEALVYARTPGRAQEVLRELLRRGIASADGRIRAASFEEGAARSERVISYDVPFSGDELKRVHANGGTVLVTPAERPHLMRIVREVSFATKNRRAKDMDTSEIDTFHEIVRAAIATEDLDAQLLMLDALFDEHAPAEVAAALSAMLRKRAPLPGRAPAGAATSASAGEPPKDATTGGLTRLFLSVGTRDNIRPGDLVGAITGEAGIKGEQVGRVDIRESFSVVEVAVPVADKVIRALNGTTMRGRSLRVDYDRKGANTSGGSARGDSERKGPPRGGPRGAGGAGGAGGGAPRRR